MSVRQRPFYANINWNMEDISEVLPWKTTCLNKRYGKTMLSEKLMNEIIKEENKSMPTHTTSDWIGKLTIAYDFPQLKSDKEKFTPKSIEQSADHKTVVVIWTDNTKTIVRLSSNDSDDIYMAFTAALAKKIFGSNSKIKKVIGTHLNEHKPKKKKTEEEL